MNFDELMRGITKNVSYWSWYISSKTSIEKEDAYQELLLIVWKEYCSRVESGRPTTKYFMQKRLYYASTRMIRNFYHSMESLSTAHLEYEEGNNILDERVEDSKVKEWFRSICDDVSSNNSVDERVGIIFSMLRNGFRNSEIAKSLGMKQNTLSIIITRRIKKPLREEIERNPFLDVVRHNDFVGVYS